MAFGAESKQVVLGLDEEQRVAAVLATCSGIVQQREDVGLLLGRERPRPGLGLGPGIRFVVDPVPRLLELVWRQIDPVVGLPLLAMEEPELGRCCGGPGCPQLAGGPGEVHLRAFTTNINRQECECLRRGMRLQHPPRHGNYRGSGSGFQPDAGRQPAGCPLDRRCKVDRQTALLHDLLRRDVAPTLVQRAGLDGDGRRLEQERPGHFREGREDAVDQSTVEGMRVLQPGGLQPREGPLGQGQSFHGVDAGPRACEHKTPGPVVACDLARRHRWVALRGDGQQ